MDNLQNNSVRSLQSETNLRVIQPSQVEPIVYRSNQSIISSQTTTPNVSTIELASSQSTLASYLPKSGISALNDVPSCHIHQVFEINESIPGGSENRFTIKTHNNQTIFLASEGSSPRDRLFWGSSRAFLMHLMDRQHQEALTMSRVFGCRLFCLPLKMQAIEVWLNPGILLGIVQEKFSLTDRLFVIESERGQEMYKVRISFGHSICIPKEYHFRIMTADEQTQSGTITRQWNSDLSCYTMNIYFADPGMDSKIKSLFLGLGFLLEYLYFQSRNCC
ncbi:hypothetical protein PVAND_016663 [Polypedilum vanderplanki]|uniref:Phospholipid scramblase n=1 Tax=Polypedilum vanderplanki TaxID=319348 RepID=A0A9J6BGF4_POLVA|nr:hypothetical protein PVAND_016663 [Polypedilum vanderplanki]